MAEAKRASLLEVLKSCGADVKSLTTHAATLLANDENGKLDEEHEAMAQVVAGSMNGTVGVALAKYLASELLEVAKPEAAEMLRKRKAALAESKK